MSGGRSRAVTQFLDGTMLSAPKIEFHWEKDGDELQKLCIKVLHTKNPDNWTYAELAFYRKWILTIPVQMDMVGMCASFKDILEKMTEEVADKVQARLLSDPTLNDENLHTYP